MRFLFGLLLGFFITVAHTAYAEDASSLEGLQFVTAKSAHTVQVEAMRSDAQRARGLMYRRYLPDDRGMLFEFDSPRVIGMWMKNTYLPLDMVFIDRSGKIVSIVMDAEPMSERIISSGAPASAVVELNAGAVRKMGLATGDRVKHPFFMEK